MLPCNLTCDWLKVPDSPGGHACFTEPWNVRRSHTPVPAAIQLPETQRPQGRSVTGTTIAIALKNLSPFPFGLTLI